MRIIIPSMEHAKRVSKRLRAKLRATPPVSLAQAQGATAQALGYKDWHELERVTNSGSFEVSLPDHLIPLSTAQQRRSAQTIKIVKALALPMTAAFAVGNIVDEVMPSDFQRDKLPSRLEDDVFPLDWFNLPSPDEQDRMLLMSFDNDDDEEPSSFMRVASMVTSSKSLEGQSTNEHLFHPGNCTRVMTLFYPPDWDGTPEPRCMLRFGFTVELVERSGFVDQLQAQVVHVEAEDALPPIYFQIAATHFLSYLNQPRLHPDFHAELTSNPDGLKILLEQRAEGVAAETLLDALTEALTSEEEEYESGGYLMDQFIESTTTNLFVRALRVERFVPESGVEAEAVDRAEGVD